MQALTKKKSYNHNKLPKGALQDWREMADAYAVSLRIWILQHSTQRMSRSTPGVEG